MRLTYQVLALAVGVALAGSAVAQIKPQHADVAARAAKTTTANPALAQLADGETVSAKNVVIGPNGTEHVRFARSYRGLPVIGGDFVVHTRRNGEQTATSTIKSTARPATVKPAISANSAHSAAAGLSKAMTSGEKPTSRLVLLAHDQPEPKLAYEVRVSGVDADGNPMDMMYFIDAQTGALLTQWSNLQTQRRPLPPPPTPPAEGVGYSLYLGAVPITTRDMGGQLDYRLQDPSRGNGEIKDALNRGVSFGSIPFFARPMLDEDNMWGNHQPKHRQSAAADAFYGIAASWDYYDQIHGRNGIYDDGKGVVSYVHVGINWNNAAWSPPNRSMYFGDGDGKVLKPLVALDVAGHEMSHGVITTTAGLIYLGESGALNESSADIFGTMIERHASLALGRDYDWMIGEDMLGPEAGRRAFRFLFKPSLDRGPDAVSADCYFDGANELPVHRGSGIGNHFFYLLSEGAVVPEGGWDLTPADLVCNGNTNWSVLVRMMPRKFCIWP